MKKKSFRANGFFYLGVFFLLLPTLIKFYTGETGRLLAMASKNPGAGFQNSVVYIQRHDLEGAHGYIVNLPLEAAEYKKLPAYLSDKKLAVFHGGPLEYPERITILEKTADLEQPVRVVRFDDAVGGDPDYLKKVIENPDRYRIIAGYSGWGVFQLEREIQRGDWATTILNPDWVFAPGLTPREVWFKTFQADERKRKPRNPDTI